jgi:microcystin-dependent protein
MWSGAIGSIPAGWVLCNGSGTLSNGNPVPDFRDRFIVGAGSTYSVGATGGSNTHTHTVAVTVNDHALTVAELPSHSHGVPGSISSSGGTVTFDGNNNGSSFTIESEDTGGGAGHNHTASGIATASSSLPLYYAAAYIIKT